MGISTPTIGLMTIPYYMEIMGVLTRLHIRNPYYWVEFPIPSLAIKVTHGSQQKVEGFTDHRDFCLPPAGQNVCEEMAGQAIYRQATIWSSRPPKFHEWNLKSWCFFCEKVRWKLHLLFQWLIFMVKHVKLQGCMCFFSGFNPQLEQRSHRWVCRPGMWKKILGHPGFPSKDWKGFLMEHTHNGWWNIEKANSLFNYTIWKVDG